MKKNHPHKQNILLVNITRLGDMLQATPTIAGMKLENPHAKITVLVEKQFEEVCRHLPFIDDVVSIDLGMTCRHLAREQDGIVDAYEYVSEFVADLRSRNFDYCLNMSSSAYTALLLKLVGIERNGGWVSDEEGHRVISSDWARLFATSVFHQNRQLNSLNLVDVFRCSADVELHPNKLQFTVPEEARSYCRTLVAEAGFTNTGPLVVVQAGASQGKRQWAKSQLVRVTSALVNRHNARVVMVGTKKELSIIEPVRAAVNSPNVCVAAGRTNIPQLAALLESADVLVTGDTGTMHVSVSVGTPVVAMFLASAYGFETGPYGEGHLVMQPVIGCGPCNPNKPCIGLECHDAMDPELVADLAIQRAAGDITKLSPELLARLDPSKVILYRSTFDQYGFCDLVPLNSAAHDPLKPYRDAYRKLWLDELGGFLTVPTGPAMAPRSALRQLSEVATGLQGLHDCGVEGEQTISELVAIIRNPSASPRLLGELNSKLTELDRRIEELGFHHSQLGPLARMFLFAKENLSGSDPVELASQMGRAYQDLQRRSRKLGYLVETVEEKSIVGATSYGSSSN